MMNGKLEQIEILEKKLQKIEERIATLKVELTAIYLIDEKDWEQDDESASREQELKSLEAERDEIQAKLERLKNQG